VIVDPPGSASWRGPTEDERDMLEPWTFGLELGRRGWAASSSSPRRSTGLVVKLPPGSRNDAQGMSGQFSWPGG